MFTHLHVHTEYSLLDGKSKIKELVARAKELGYTSLAITDHGVMYGCLSFYKECKAQGIKPIIGCEVYVAPDSRFSKQGSSDNDDRYNHLVLLCKDATGYKNLCKIVTTGFTEGFYYKPRVDEEVLKAHSEGLICLSACLAGAVPSKLMKNDYEGALETARTYQQIFGRDNYFIELQDHGIQEERMVVQPLVRIANEIGAGLVVTNDSHYTVKEEAIPHDILLCLQTGKKLSDEKRMRFQGQEFYLKSEDEMRQLFPSLPQAYDNTTRIADMCNFEYELGITRLPVYDYPPQYASDYEYFKYLCYDGAKKRYGENLPNHVADQVEYELGVIHRMGYVDYFLIVWDFINWAKEHEIPVGPGRGSGAGSICAYAIGITNIDPLQYGLFFERFLNPERVSMPDFDIDFCYNRAAEVEDYVRQKYGEERVSKIITFQTMAARGSIRDVGRVLDYPYAEVDKIAKMIPNDAKTIDDALKTNMELKAVYDSDERVRVLINNAKSIEGMPKSTSQHAAGVLICDKPITEYAPMMTSDGVQVIQANMLELEDLGLLKFDFLRLRTLTVIDETLKIIDKECGNKINIDTIDLHDQKVFANLSTGKMYGVFQFESAGMKDMLDKLRPTCVEDLTAIISLYRPGPMESIPRYIRCKHHPEEVTYYHPCVKEILEPTYGCLVYQEQIMKVFQVMAGFSLGRADIVRRAMSKKKDSILKKEFEIFRNGLHDENNNIEGAIAKGIPESVCETILNDMTDFSRYAFNKSHAACYAVIAYQTAWLATYYPNEFYAAYLTSFIGENQNLKKKCYEVKKEAGISLLPPDINKSDTKFVVSGDDVLFGLGALSGIGPAVTDRIVAERTNNGPFKNLFDFVNRLDGGDKKMIEALIYSGSLDSISEGHNRNEMIVGYPALQKYVNDEKQSSMSGQYSLFDFLPAEAKEATIPKLPTLPDFSSDEKLRHEKETAYMYLSSHPLDNYRHFVANIKTDEITNIIESIEEKTGAYNHRQSVTCPVIISGINKKITKKGTNVWFFTASDGGSDISVVGFDKFVNQYGFMLEDDKCCILKGKLDQRDDETWQIIADEVILFPMTNSETDAFVEKIRPQEKRQQNYHQNQQNIIKKPKTEGKYKNGLHLAVQSWDFATKEILPLLETIPGNYPVFLYFKNVKDGEMKSAEYLKGVNMDSAVVRTIIEKVGIPNAKWQS